MIIKKKPSTKAPAIGSSLKKPTIIRGNEPHQVVIDKGWRFPRVAATVGFKDEDRLTI